MARLFLVLLSWFVLCGCAYAQGMYPALGSDLDLSKANTLPAGRIQTRGAELVIGAAAVRLVGTNLTDGACFPDDPARIASLIRRKGYNAVRLHHIDRILGDIWSDAFPRLHRFVKALGAVGIRVSLDLYSKGREHIEGNDAFKLALYEQKPFALDYLKEYAQKLLGSVGPDGTRLADDPNVWLVCLVNEGGTLLGNTYGDKAGPMARDFFKLGKGWLSAVKYQGLIADLPDGFVHPDVFGPVVKDQDVALFHIYGDDAREIGDKVSFSTYWAAQGWQWGGGVNWAKVTGKPLVVQEYGSLAFNPYRGANTAFAVAEISRRGWSSLAFSWADNQSRLESAGDTVDWYRIASDLPRLLGDTLSTFLTAYDKRVITSVVWGHELGRQSVDYDYLSTHAMVKVRGSRAVAMVALSGTLSAPTRVLVFSFAPAVGEGFQDGPVDNETVKRRVTAPGGVSVAVPVGQAVELPTTRRVTSAYQLDPWTGERLASLTVLGGAKFRPVYGLGVCIVNLR